LPRCRDPSVNITLYAALGGSSSASDKIIINGGSGTGTSLLTIKNVGGGGARRQAPAYRSWLRPTAE